MRIWKFHIDWNNPLASTFTGPTNLTVARFGGSNGNVIPQYGVLTRLQSIGVFLMKHLQYRNLNGVESLWANHTVNSGGVTGIRWYEVRNPNGVPVLFQQATFQPDTKYRWDGSLAVDGKGNMALGYSVSSADMYPALRYAGRLVGGARHRLTVGETVLIQGTGAETHPWGAWGDYSAMTVDPVDNCTFWFTSEYFAASGVNWQTRIGSLKFPNCP